MKWIENCSESKVSDWVEKGYVIGEPKTWALADWERLRMINKHFPLFPPTVEKLKKDGYVGIYEPSK